MYCHHLIVLGSLICSLINFFVHFPHGSREVFFQTFTFVIILILIGIKSFNPYYEIYNNNKCYQAYLVDLHMEVGGGKLSTKMLGRTMPNNFHKLWLQFWWQMIPCLMHLHEMLMTFDLSTSWSQSQCQ